MSLSRGLWVTVFLLALAVAARDAAAQTSDSAAATAAAANLQLGISYMRQNQLALAKEKLEKARKQAPKDPDVHSAMAMLYERLGNARDADKAHKTALRLAPQRPEFSNNYAVYLCRTGRHADGIKRFLEVAANKLYTAPQAAFTNAGVCARNGGKTDEAASYLRRALQAMPNHAEAVIQLVDLEMSRSRLTEARTEVDRYLNSFVAQPDVLLSCVRVTRAQADRVAEEKCARRLRADFPTSPAARTLQTLAPRGS